jgi:glycosyltransferase involved in cell wall biosynthesis
VTRLSGTIVSLNEAANIERAIRSLRFTDEIVVVDSGSTDGTQALAERLGARVIEHAWQGYAGQKNFAAQQARHDWILSIDADEEVSPALAEEIAAVMRAGPEASGYQFPRLARYLGGWIRHSGWYPDRKVRLYDRRRGAWTGDFVHESITLEGPARALNGDLLHYTCDSLGQHLRTIDRYTALAAQEVAARGATVSLRRLTVDPVWSFVRAFVIERGFLDGVRGLTIAWMAALYTFLKYARAREMAGRYAHSAS